MSDPIEVQRQVVTLKITSPLRPGSFAPDSWDWHSLLDLGGGPASTVSVVNFGPVDVLSVDPDEEQPASTPTPADSRDS
jgi:hypothetical protein